jgi:hypothetical protein
MQKVDGILLPSRLVSELQTASRLPLAGHELGKPVKLPAVASIGAGGPDAIAQIAHIPAKVSKTLGVDAWR